jgi:Transglutaminase-like superfamily
MDRHVQRPRPVTALARGDVRNSNPACRRGQTIRPARRLKVNRRRAVCSAERNSAAELHSGTKGRCDILPTVALRSRNENLMPTSQRSLPPSRCFCMLLLVLALAPLAGCQKTAPTPSVSVPTQEAGDQIARSGDVSRAPPAPPAQAGERHLVEETWDAYSMQGIRIGYAHTTIIRVVEDGRELIRTESRIHTSMQRSGQSITQDMTLVSWDKPEGGLVRFESRMAAGPGEIASIGAVREGALGIDTTTLGRTQSQKIPWQADWGGLFAADQSLRCAPLKPGEKRVVKSLLPLMNMVAETRLEAQDYEAVELPSGTAKLLKINSIVDLGGQKIESIVWTDEKGETLRSLVPSLRQESVRTTKADAVQQSGDKQYDLLLASTVPLQGTLPNPHQTRRAVYRAHLKGGAIAGLFSDCLSQRVQPIDEQTAQITVTAVRPDQPQGVAGAPEAPPPAQADSAANNFIQSDDLLVTQLAARVAPDESDPWTIACALEKFVDDTVHNKNFSTAFATAAEVARSLEGDCTEHAVLLAALCRARKIPTRVSFGLVYYPPEKGFAYHMWNEVWIKDRWVPLDPTLGLGGIGADHIKLGDSNLAGGSPLADLLAVIQVFGRLELEVLEAE